MELTQLLERTHALQTEAFGADPTQLEGEEFAAFIRWNVLAAQVELGEFIQELPWKPWKDGAGRPDPAARGRAVEELIDVLHFLANLLVAMRVDGEELDVAYAAKNQVNRDRQAARARVDRRAEWIARNTLPAWNHYSPEEPHTPTREELEDLFRPRYEVIANDLGRPGHRVMDRDTNTEVAWFVVDNEQGTTFERALRYARSRELGE